MHLGLAVSSVAKVRFEVYLQVLVVVMIRISCWICNDAPELNCRDCGTIDLRAVLWCWLL